MLRRRTLIVFGLLWFGLALGPTSQIIPHHVDRADRFLYLPLVGLALAAAMGLRPLLNALKHQAAAAAILRRSRNPFRPRWLPRCLCCGNGTLRSWGASNLSEYPTGRRSTYNM